MWLIIFILVWGVSMVGWLVLSKAYQRSDIDRFSSRLLGTAKATKAKSAENKSLLQEERDAGKVVAALLKKYNLLPRLEQLIEQAGLKWHPVRVVHACLALFIVAFGVWWMMTPGQFRRFAFAVGLVAAALPILYLYRARRSRMRKFEEQFPESLEFVARSMRAGHAFAVSLEMIHKEFQEPSSAARSTNTTSGYRSTSRFRSSQSEFRRSMFTSLCRLCSSRNGPEAIWPKSWTNSPTSSGSASSSADASARSARMAA